jgi:hypothetical protein
MPTLSLSRAALALHGVARGELQPPLLRPEIIYALKPLLEEQGFDLTQPIHVRELPDFRGFRLTQ